jgi:hypothetical protein
MSKEQRDEVVALHCVGMDMQREAGEAGLTGVHACLAQGYLWRL